MSSCTGCGAALVKKFRRGRTPSRCESCKKKTKLAGDRRYVRTYRHPNPGKRRAQANELNRQKRRRERAAVFAAYGGKCACCGETQYEFLSIDHVAGGGTKHRASLTMSMEHFLYKNGFPSGYRLLCHNCNQAIGYYGRCPHGLTRGEPEPSTEPQMALV